MFQRKILQGPTYFIILRQQQNVIIQLEGIKHTEINANRYCRSTLFYPRNSQRRTCCPFSHLYYTKIATQTSQFDLLTYRLHLLFKFSGQLIAHCCLAHIDTQLIFTSAKIQQFLYFMICY